MNIKVAGENSLIVYFKDPATSSTSQKISQLITHLTPYFNNQIIDTVPSYGSVLIIYNPEVCDHLWLRHIIGQCAPFAVEQQNHQKLIELPVYYGKEVGLDLERIAQHANLTTEDVIQIHLQKRYQVFAIGFAPGFAYLGNLDQRIAMARLKTPRAKVIKGAVAIADRQTAVYPASSPGGWNIIGNCPTPLFDANQTPTMPISVGDQVAFYQIDKKEYLALGATL